MHQQQRLGARIPGGLLLARTRCRRRSVDRRARDFRAGRFRPVARTRGIRINRRVIGYNAPMEEALAGTDAASTSHGRRASLHTAKDIVHSVRRQQITTAALLGEEMHYDDIGRYIKPLESEQVLQRLARLPGDRADRRQQPIQLHPSTGVLVGVDVTNDRAKIAVTDAAYARIAKSEVREKSAPLKMDDPDQALAEIADLVAIALRGTGFDEGQMVIGVGLTLPGPLRREDDLTRVPDSRSVLPDWRGVRVAERLSQLLGAKGVRPPRSEGGSRQIVAVENDASAGALGVFTHALRAYYDSRVAPGTPLDDDRMAELWEALRRKRIEDLVYVRVTHGVGAGVVSKGHLVEGGRGHAGELAHVRCNPTGPICPVCGGLGCLETWCSERALTERLAVVDEEEIQSALERGKGSTADQTAKLLSSERRGGREAPLTHPAVQQAIWDAGWHLGVALSHVCALLNPQLVVLGGAMTETGPFVTSALNAVTRNTIPQLSSDLALMNWRQIYAEQGDSFTPELLGALAKAQDECGDGYYLGPVEDWAADRDSGAGVIFDARCDPPSGGRRRIVPAEG